MFMPAARTVASLARIACAEGAMPTRSMGVQSAPRANTRTPFTCRSIPPRRTSAVPPALAETERNPTRPASAVSGSPPPEKRRRTL